MGFPIQKIATYLNIPLKVVLFHKKSIKLKLQCNTTGDLILFSVQHGLAYLCEMLVSQDTIKSVKNKYVIATDKGNVKLSKREAQCLFYLSKGFSTKTIAKKLEISPRTIEEYRSKIKKKFHCRTRIEILSKTNNLDAVKAWNTKF